MQKFKVFIAESVFAEDLYGGNREGEVIEAIARVLHWKSSHKIVLNPDILCKAIYAASKGDYDILHLSCHGDEDGIQLSDETELSWSELADRFQDMKWIPKALVISSCVGGDRGIARAFANRKRKPSVIFGAEGKRGRRITFPGACISWPILYTLLARAGLTRDAFKDAVTKMNLITNHEFVYRRWSQNKYRRYPRLRQPKRKS
jgi:hypothetical protein